MLADFGAAVVMVEPPAGSPIRALAPFDRDGTSILAAYVLANKQSVVLDFEDRAQNEQVRELIGRADVLISSASPSILHHIGLTYARLGRPALIMAHLTPFGMTGDLAEAPGNDLAVAALSGWASINGLAAREPLKPSGWQAAYCAGTAAYAAILAALRHRDLHPGEGQEIDVAEVEVMAAAFAPAMLGAMYSGENRGRRKELDMTGGPVPVADGFFALTISRAHFWRDAMNVLGLTDLAEDPRWEPSYYRAAHKDEYVHRVEAAMHEWNKMELFDELASRRVVAGPVLTMADLVKNDHLRGRGFWTKPTGEQTSIDYPGPSFRMSETPWELRTAAPTPGDAT
jgi:crotonobetainyl-CoA:carnitine CoA-transferase CaiB-like acyl-CoA transferase